MQTTIKQFFKEGFDINIDDMIIGKEIEVSSYNKSILSFNKVTNKNEYKKVLKVVRKPNAKIYSIYANDKITECSNEHKLYVKHSLDKMPFYCEVGNIIKSKLIFYILTEEGKWKTIDKIVLINKKEAIYDFEVEDNNNYYANGILSHNTMFGDSRIPTGGNSLKFYASVRLQISRSTTEANSIKEGEEKIGNLTKVKVLKNKLASPFRTCEFDIIYGKGIWKEKELLDFAVAKKIIEKSGSWFSYKGTKIGQGVSQSCQTLEDNPDLFNEIKAQV